VIFYFSHNFGVLI